MNFLRRLFGIKPKSELSSDIDEVIETLSDEVDEAPSHTDYADSGYETGIEVSEEEDTPDDSTDSIWDGVKEETEPASDPQEETEEPRLTWQQFRSAHKGTPSSEISGLWKEYKEGSYEVRS
tara:strand:+ start:171 stop:536 length:366 start_codon:yes stop_codon:yes gene_type:complete